MSNMQIGLRDSIEISKAVLDVRAIDVTLDNGVIYTIKNLDDMLDITTDYTLAVYPRATNGVRLQAVW